MPDKRRRKKKKRKTGNKRMLSKQFFAEQKYISVSLVLSIGICLLMIGIGLSEMDGKRELEAMEAISGAVEYEPVYPCTRADLNTDMEKAAEIDLSKADMNYTITDAGSYLLYGDYEGQICVDAEEQIVHLFLKNVNLVSPSGPAIDIRAAGKVIITLAEGTSNTIQDKAYYRKRDEGDAAVYSTCDLTINGGGVLTVHGFYDKGIHSRDIVKILGGEIAVQAKGNGIQGNDGMRIEPAALSVESEGCGLYSKKTGNENKGTIEITGGDIRIIAGQNAISSSNNLYVNNCSLWSNSVLDAFHVSGSAHLTEGCIEDE